MKFLKSFIVAAVAVRAEQEEDDFDFIRELLVNDSDSNVTTTAPPATTLAATTLAANTTLAPTTTDPTATAAPTTTVSGTSAPTTSAPDTSAPNTSAPNTSAPGTSAPGTSAPGAPVTLPPVVVDPNNTNRNPGINATTEIEMSSEVKVTPPFTPPTLRPGSALRLRRLASHLTQAYNYFCSAFTLTSGLIACQAMQNAGQIPAEGVLVADANNQYYAGNVLFPSLAACQVDIKLMVDQTNCADVSTTSKGHCIRNPSNYGFTEHLGCTQHEHIAGSTQYKYKTRTKFVIPGFAAPTQITAANTAKAATTTAMQSPTAVNALQAYVVVAVVEMANNHTIAHPNFTAAFGMSTTEIDAATNALTTGGDVTAGIAAYASDPTGNASPIANALVQAVDRVSSANSDLRNPQFTVTTVTGTTSAAAMVGFSFFALLAAFL